MTHQVELTEFDSQNRVKEDFHSVYNRPEPYEYYGALAELDYAIPSKAKPVFTQVLQQLRETRGQDKVKILDLGCSYGVNSALLKYDLELDELYHYYDSRGKLATASAVKQDSKFFEEQEPAEDLEIVGVDVAERAVGYARATGLLDEAIAINLETEGFAPEKVTDVDIVISTGCVGYVTDRTFSHLVTGEEDVPPWVASFVLRMFPYNSIEETLAAAGLVTEKLQDHLFPQRSFATLQERQDIAENLVNLGVDPSRELTNDQYYAEFFLSRTPDEVSECPLEIFLNDVPESKTVPVEDSHG